MNQDNPEREGRLNAVEAPMQRLFTVDAAVAHLAQIVEISASEQAYQHFTEQVQETVTPELSIIVTAEPQPIDNLDDIYREIERAREAA